MSDWNSSNIGIIILVILTGIAALVALIMTSIFASKKGTSDRMIEEGLFLDALSGSSSCTCQTPTVTPTVVTPVVVATK